MADLARKRRRKGPQLGHRELSSRLEKLEAAVGSRRRRVFSIQEIEPGVWSSPRAIDGQGPAGEPGPDDLVIGMPGLWLTPDEEAAAAVREKQVQDAKDARAMADALYLAGQAEQQETQVQVPEPRPAVPPPDLLNLPPAPLPEWAARLTDAALVKALNRDNDL